MILDLLPDSSGYAYADDANEYDSVRFDSAAGAYSRGIPGVKRFTCTWTLAIEDYIVFNAFYNARLADMDSFQIDLISELGELAPHVVKFDYPTYMLSGQSGDVFTVSCALLGKPGTK